MAQCINAVQTVLPREDIPTGLTVINFMNLVGGTVLVSVSQGVLTDTLRSKLSDSLPDFDTSIILGQGATDLSKAVDRADLPILIEAYNLGLRYVFYVAMAVSLLACVASCFLEWRTVKGPKEKTASDLEEKV